MIHWWLLWPLAIFAWWAMHISGVHATIAGVLLGMSVPALANSAEDQPLTNTFGEKFEFCSAGFVLPIFAFFAAGVNVVDEGGIFSLLADPVAIGIYIGLPLGKCLGIWGGSMVMTKFAGLKLGKGLHLGDIFAVSLVAGVGFTVSLLIATLSFPPTDPHSAYAKVAVIVGSLLSIIAGALALRWRARVRLRDVAARPHEDWGSGDASTGDTHLDGRPNVEGPENQEEAQGSWDSN